MAHKALYRQFRPRRFEDLKGQEVVATVLRNQVSAGEPSHAYLFSGPRGTGKTSTAKILACALNCLNPKDGEPCLECENCKAALEDAMIDIIEMDAASNNSVDNARDIRDKVGLLPAKGKYKVYIIDEVHMLTGSAFNALLKTLEEPPEHVVFILATTELAVLPKTVLSRCQRFDFRRIGEEDIVARLEEVAKEIGIQVQKNALLQIAVASEGALRDALTILDKCCSFGEEITEQIVSQVLGYAGYTALYALVGAMAEYDDKAALAQLTAILDAGIEAGVLVGQLLECFHRMLLDAVEERGEQSPLWQASEMLGKKALLRGVEIFSAAQGNIRFAARPEIMLESAVLRFLLPEGEKDASALEYRVQRLEQQLARLEQSGLQRPVVEKQPAPAQGVRGEKKAIEQKAETIDSEAAQEKKEEITKGEAWEAVMEYCEKNPSTKPFFGGLQPVALKQGKLLLEGGNPSMLRLLEGSGLKAEIEKMLMEKMGCRIVLEIAEQKGQEELYQEDRIDIID